MSAFDKELIGPALTLKNSLLPIILDVILTFSSPANLIATLLALLNSVQNNQFWTAVSRRNKIDLGHNVYAKSTSTGAAAPNITLES